MENSNQDRQFIERVESAYDAMHCPACDAKAALMMVGWNPQLGTWAVYPVFSCDTPGCEFSMTAESAWTPVLMP